MSAERRLDLALAALFGRLMLGLLFAVQGWHKVFEMGPMKHARRFFLEGYTETWIPAWLLGSVGVTVPFVELVAGALLLVGFWIRPVLVVLGALLLMVTYGHLLAEPFFDVTTHIFPRAVFLLFLLVLPRSADRWSMDALVARRAEHDSVTPTSGPRGEGACPP